VVKGWLAASASEEMISAGIGSFVKTLLFVWRFSSHEKRGSVTIPGSGMSSILARGCPRSISAPGNEDGKSEISAMNPASRAAISRFSMNAPQETQAWRDAGSIWDRRRFFSRYRSIPHGSLQSTDQGWVFKGLGAMMAYQRICLRISPDLPP